MCTSFEVTRTAIHYAWEHNEHAPGGEITRLSLSARPDGGVRGRVHRPGVFYHVLRIDNWELMGPAEPEAAWAIRARHALRQLHLRLEGKPHTTPEADGRWDVEVHQWLRVTGAPDVTSHLSEDWAFTPREMFVDVSTNGDGSLLLFGADLMEINSTRYNFTVGLGGLVAFDQLDPNDRVPDWAQEPALEATLMAFDLRAEAARLLVDEATGARA